MSQTVNLDRAEIAQAALAKEGLNPGPPPGTVEELKAGKGSMDVSGTYVPGIGNVDIRTGSTDGDGAFDDKPTEEEMNTLRRVSGHINWAAYSVAVCELAERFSYYGSSVLYTNFVVHPLPEGSNTGAGYNRPGGQSGALGLGSRAGQGISLTNQFFAYLVPLAGYVIQGQEKALETFFLLSSSLFPVFVVLLLPGKIGRTAIGRTDALTILLHSAVVISQTRNWVVTRRSTLPSA